MLKEFEVHKLSEEGFAKATRIAEAFNALLLDLIDVLPSGRELAIVRTKLEEACFFAKKGVANQAENQLRGSGSRSA